MYKRVLLKLSGEALSGNSKNFDADVLHSLAEEIKEAQSLGVEIAIVVGGGNFIRGKTVAEIGIDRVQGDYMGMLATIMNALAIQASLESVGLETRVQTSIALSASEIKADAILMAKNGVDGVYNADPKKDPTATRFEHLTYMDLLNKGLQVMDSTATSMCMDNDMELVVFNMNEKGNIVKAMKGEAVCTRINKEEK